VLAAIGGLLALGLLDAVVDLPLALQEGMLFRVRADSVAWYGPFLAFPLDIDGDGNTEIVASTNESAYDTEDYVHAWNGDGRQIVELLVTDKVGVSSFLADGWAVPAGDLDGDGRGEILFPLPDQPTVVTPASGAYCHLSVPLDDRVPLAGVDLDGDACADVVLVSWDESKGLRIQARSGRTLEPLPSSEIDADRLPALRPARGGVLAWCGDVDGDSVQDFACLLGGVDADTALSDDLIAAGWAERDPGGELRVHRGVLVQISGRDFREIRRRALERTYALPTTQGLDIDGDGADEIVLEHSGGALVLSGCDLATSSEFESTLGGTLLAPVGDPDGDGAMDFAEVDLDRVVVRTAAGARLELVDDLDGDECQADLTDFDRDGRLDLILAVAHSPTDRPDWIPWRRLCPRESRITVWSGAWLRQALTR
jgi:hypothetical protein